MICCFSGEAIQWYTDVVGERFSEDLLFLVGRCSVIHGYSWKGYQMICCFSGEAIQWYTDVVGERFSEDRRFIVSCK